jgi:hypothetical protein
LPTKPIINFLPDVIGSKAVAIMDVIFEPTALPFDGLQILVRQSYPFLLDALLGLFPISLDMIPIHLNLRARTGLLESEFALQLVATVGQKMGFVGPEVAAR